MSSTNYAIAGACTGLLVGLTGIGGGSLMTPILLLLGVAPGTAVATDLWFATITKCAAVGIHQRGGAIDWRVVRKLWLGSLPVAAVTVAVVSREHISGSLGWLTTAVGGAVLVTAVGLIAAPRLQAWARNSRLGEPDRFKSRQPVLTVMAGALLGLLVALTSIGAGAVGTVMLLWLYPLRMTPQKLVATDIAHAIPLAMVAGGGYLLMGQVDISMLLPMLAGSLPAVVLGSIIARRARPRWLQIGVAIVLFCVAGLTLRSALAN